ncbi:MAG: alkaline phosphatase PhoX, partial [Chloroflexota bacterium]
MRTRLIQVVVTLLAITALALPTLASGLSDVLSAENQPEFLKASAVDEKFEGPGNEAVVVAKGLQVELVSDKVAVWADMIAPWPNDAEPTHLFVAIEQRENNYPTAEQRESVQVVDLSTNEVATILYGLSSTDGIRITPWGTVLVTEEQDDGGAWEIIDPLNIREAVVDRVAHTSNNPNIVYRPALGTFAWEGIAVLPDGTLYAGDELRPENDADGGAIFKFVPATPLAKDAKVTRPEESPFAAGTLNFLSLGASTTKDKDGKEVTRDYGQGNQTGTGRWIAIEDPAKAREEADANGATAYYRPEDMHVDPLALAKGIVRLYWANTGNDSANYYGEVMVMIDGNKGKTPNVQYFLLGDGPITQPDNIAIHPTTGDIYVIEDYAFGDVWVCKKDGPDAGAYTDGCGRILSVRDNKGEPTGFILTGDGDTAYLNVQHRIGAKDEKEGRQYDDLIKVTGLNALLP